MKFIYHGPTSGVTLQDGREVMLFNGHQVDLPESSEYTKTLQALGHLTPVATPTKQSKTKESANGG